MEDGGQRQMGDVASAPAIRTRVLLLAGVQLLLRATPTKLHNLLPAKQLPSLLKCYWYNLAASTTCRTVSNAWIQIRGGRAGV
jgi:hypothetical protein